MRDEFCRLRFHQSACATGITRKASPVFGHDIRTSLLSRSHEYAVDPDGPWWATTWCTCGRSRCSTAMDGASPGPLPPVRRDRAKPYRGSHRKYYYWGGSIVPSCDAVHVLCVAERERLWYVESVRSYLFVPPTPHLYVMC